MIGLATLFALLSLASPPAAQGVDITFYGVLVDDTGAPTWNYRRTGLEGRSDELVVVVEGRSVLEIPLSATRKQALEALESVADELPCTVYDQAIVAIIEHYPACTTEPVRVGGKEER